jgi:hypothetical protein
MADLSRMRDRSKEKSCSIAWARLRWAACHCGGFSTCIQRECVVDELVGDPSVVEVVKPSCLMALWVVGPQHASALTLASKWPFARILLDHDHDHPGTISTIPIILAHVYIPSHTPQKEATEAFQATQQHLTSTRTTLPWQLYLTQSQTWQTTVS